MSSHAQEVGSLAAAIARRGDAVDMLRNSEARAFAFPATPEFTNWRDEQRAWREGCALLDQSHHMEDFYLSGPDALNLLRDLGVNSFENFTPSVSKHYVVANDDGYLIGDAVLFYLEEERFNLVGANRIVNNWVRYHLETGDYRADFELDPNSRDRVSGPPRVYRYELQGPTALEVMQRAAGAVPSTKFFHMYDFTIAGHRVRALRHGMAGQPGFEIFGPWSEGEAVLDALLEAGRDAGLQRVGAKAYSTANLESGYIAAPLPGVFDDTPELARFREWLPADAVGAIGGSIDSSDVHDYYVTPYEMGYGRYVAFDHDFVGRDALRTLADDPTQRRKVTLVWNSDDFAGVFGSMVRGERSAKAIELPKARYARYQSDQVRADGRQVGMSTDCGYIANERAMVSLALVEPELSEPGTEVTVVWGELPPTEKPAVEDHVQREIRATVAPAPFVDFARDKYRAN